MKAFVIIFLSLVASQMSFAKPEMIFKGYARFKIKPQHLLDFKKEVEKIIDPTLKEKDCLQYEAFQVLNEQGLPTNEFIFHEVWRSKKAMMIDHKEKSTHMINFFAKIKIGQPDSYVESFEVSGTDVRPLSPMTRYKELTHF